MKVECSSWKSFSTSARPFATRSQGLMRSPSGAHREAMALASSLAQAASKSVDSLRIASSLAALPVVWACAGRQRARATAPKNSLFMCGFSFFLREDLKLRQCDSDSSDSRDRSARLIRWGPPAGHGGLSRIAESVRVPRDRWTSPVFERLRRRAGSEAARGLVEESGPGSSGPPILRSPKRPSGNIEDVAKGPSLFPAGIHDESAMMSPYGALAFPWAWRREMSSPR